MPTILAGDRPTGLLHLSHYVGSLRKRVALLKSAQLQMRLIFLAMICLLISPVWAARIVNASRAGNVALVYFPPANLTSAPQPPQVWSLRPWKRKCVLRGQFKGWVRGWNSEGGAAFSSDGRLVALGFDKGIIEIYQTVSGKLWARLGTAQSAPATESDNYYRVNALAFSPDGKSLASSNIKGVFFWNLPNRKLQFSRPVTARAPNFAASQRLKSATSIGPASPIKLCFSPDGKTLAMAGNQTFPAFLFDVAAKRVRHVLPLDANEGGTNEIVFSPDGAKVLCVGVWAASGGSYDKIDLFDARSGRVLWRWSNAKEYLQGDFAVAASFQNAAFSSDGRCFAVGNDQTLEIRSTQDGHLLSQHDDQGDDPLTLEKQKRVIPALAVR